MLHSVAIACSLTVAMILSPFESSVTAQPQRMSPSFTPKETELPERGVDLPIERVNRLPVVEGTINGKGPFRLVVDTGGAGLFVSRELAKTLDLPGPPGMPKGMEVRASSGRGEGIPAILAHVESLRIGTAEFRELFTIAIELPVVGEFDGVVGLDVFRHCLLTLDYPASRIRLTHETLSADDPSVVAFRIAGPQRSHPVVDLMVNDTQRSFTIDTGMSGWFRFPQSYLENVTLRYGPVEGPRARMVDASFRPKLARLAGTVRVGSHTVVDPIVSISDPSGPGKAESIIGSACLEHFVFSVDQQTSLVRFERAGGTPVAARPERVLGFDLDKVDDAYVVGDIIPGSPADIAGLQVGHHLLTIDDTSIRDLHGTERWSRLTDRASLRVMIRDGAGTKELIVPVFELIPVS